MQRNIIKKMINVINFAFEKNPTISLSWKLIPDQYREHENSLFLLSMALLLMCMYLS